MGPLTYMRSLVYRNVVMQLITLLILVMFLPSENQLIIDFSIISSITEKKYYYVLITRYMLDKKLFRSQRINRNSEIHIPLFTGNLCSRRVKHIT